jgi:ABC-type multidrug transport system fused ATPase/permease subunit
MSNSKKNGRKNKSIIKYGLTFLKRYRIKLIIAIFWSVLFVIIPMQIPIITGTLVDGLDESGENPISFYSIEIGKTPYDALKFGIVSLLSVSLLYGITAYLRISHASTVSRKFVFELQRSIVQKLEFLSLDIHRKYGSGDLLNHIIVDTNNVRPFVETTIIKTITNIARISYPLVILVLIDPFLAMVAYSILPVQYLSIRKIQSKISQILSQQRNDKSRLTTLLKENLDNIETIQSSGAEKNVIGKITKDIGQIESSQIKAQRQYGMMMGCAYGLTALGMALIWWFGGQKVLHNEITLGQLVIFSGFLLFAYEPVRYFTRNIKDHHRSIIALKHVRAVLEIPSSINEEYDAPDLRITNCNIVFQHVSFSLGKKGKNILKDISIDISPKSITVLVGKSGSGKSSILKLIMRLYDPSEGKVSIDGQDIKHVSISSLRSQIALVPQSPVIFSGTIKENIILANPDASDKEIEDACIVSDALLFINKFEKGLSTIVGQGGVHLSGGEVQKIAIARALLKKPKILLLDEPTSAIDTESAKHIMNTLNSLKKSMTIIIVDHSINSVVQADNIITINDGFVVDNTRKTMAKELYNGSYLIYDQEDSSYTLLNHNQPNITNITPLVMDIMALGADTRNSESIEHNRIEYKVIGRSTNNRRIEVILVGDNKNPKLKVFILAGQHGDEKGSRQSTLRLIDHLIRTKEFPDICVGVLSNANPDAAFKNKRKNDSEIDLNRDHLLLMSQENRAIHSFVQSWKPDVLIDVHNYPPIKEYLEKNNRAFYQDVLIDMPTNPSIMKKFDKDQFDNLLNHLQLDLGKYDYSCDRYVLIYPEGRAAHSTDDIVDARNFFSLRHNILTILVEGKEPLKGKDKDQELERSVSAQYYALVSILKWITQNESSILEDFQTETGNRISIRNKYNEPKDPFTMKFLNTTSNEIEEFSIPIYESFLRASRTVKIPYAYAIPDIKDRLLGILHDHGFTSIRLDKSNLFKVQRYLILAAEPSISKKPRPPKNVKLIAIEEEKDLSSYVIFNTSQEGGHSLPLLLEPQSEYGLARYKELGLEITPSRDFDVLRIIDKKFIDAHNN